MQSATLINRLPEAELRAVGVWHAIDMGPDHVTLRVHHYGREYWVSATDTVRYGSWRVVVDGGTDLLNRRIQKVFDNAS